MIVHPESKIILFTASPAVSATSWRINTDGVNHVHVKVETETPVYLNDYQEEAIIEAAARSMAAGGRPEQIDGG